MLIVPELHGFRRMRPHEASEFATWEKNERPYPWSENQFLETLGSPTQQTLVWEGESELWGFAVLQTIEDETYLLNIMINPGCRRRGKGSELMDKLIEWSKACGAKWFFLDVDPSNDAAFRLYRKKGFGVVGRRPNATPRGEESFLMKKDL